MCCVYLTSITLQDLIWEPWLLHVRKPVTYYTREVASLAGMWSQNFGLLSAYCCCDCFGIKGATRRDVSIASLPSSSGYLMVHYPRPCSELPVCVCRVTVRSSNTTIALFKGKSKLQSNHTHYASHNPNSEITCFTRENIREIYKHKHGGGWMCVRPRTTPVALIVRFYLKYTYSHTL